MPFAQGTHPALTLPTSEAQRLHMVLRRAGYEPHMGSRYLRKGELRAWTAPLRGGRHIHVQECAWTSGRLALFAHTEPASGLLHAWSAVTDGANFAAGSRKLRADLTANGWRQRR